MAFTDPLRCVADFDAGDAEWLHLLVEDWHLLADLSFSDLVLWLPREGGWVAAAHTRRRSPGRGIHVGPSSSSAPTPSVSTSAGTSLSDKIHARAASSIASAVRSSIGRVATISGASTSAKRRFTRS